MSIETDLGECGEPEASVEARQGVSGLKNLGVEEAVLARAMLTSRVTGVPLQRVIDADSTSALRPPGAGWTSGLGTGSQDETGMGFFALCAAARRWRFPCNRRFRGMKRGGATFVGFDVSFALGLIPFF